MRRIFLLALFALFFRVPFTLAAVWQWSVPVTAIDPKPGEHPRTGAKSVTLSARSDIGDVPVGFHVREGPAEIEGQMLRFTAISPRTKLPLRVTVVAWQLGRSGDHPVRAAESVEQTFWIQK